MDSEEIFQKVVTDNVEFAHQAPGLLGNLEGPHEWGYRDPVEGGFVEDLAPFAAATKIRELEAQVKVLQNPDMEKLLYAVERAAEQFETYEQHHRTKDDETSALKAEVNRQLAELMREALKGSESVLRRVSQEAMPESHYEEKLEQVPHKGCQSYSETNNMSLGLIIMNAVAPHWDKVVRNAAADSVRYILGNHLTRMWCDICDFHHKFKLNYDGPPRVLPLELGDFRAKFLQEELDEYNKARAEIVAHGDSLERRADMLDALVDLVYVALGTAYLHGFNFAEAWRRVQRANMAKIRAERADQSKRGSTFDVVKPEGWKPPNHMDLVGVISARADLYNLPESYLDDLKQMSPQQKRQFLEGEFLNEEPKQHDLF